MSVVMPHASPPSAQPGLSAKQTQMEPIKKTSTRGVIYSSNGIPTRPCFACASRGANELISRIAGVFLMQEAPGVACLAL